MKHATFVAILIAQAFAITAQGLQPAQKQRLHEELLAAKAIEYCYIGCWGKKSQLYPKADSLMLSSGIEEKLDYFNDSSYPLKYYSYRYIMADNDSAAFQLLKQAIKDSVIVDIHGTTLGESINFNCLLATEYYEFIQLKYLSGGGCSKDCMFYRFPKKNKRVFKKKKQELLLLLKASNCNVPEIAG